MIYLLLGTNKGDREWNLEEAGALLAEALKCDFHCSEILETKAIGFDGADFLNEVLAFEADVEPLQLLEICQAVEVKMGRATHTARFDEQGKRIYEDRIIDIDILDFNGAQLHTERLTLPHPQVEERPFVKELLKTIRI